MRVLVTGASGFVGRHLLARFEEEGLACVGVDREVDVTEAEAVAASVREADPDAIVHLAALSSVADSTRNPLETDAVNVQGTRHVLEAAAKHAPGARVLLVTSGQIYGAAPPGAEPFDEDAPLRPESPYARSKAEADRLGAEWAARGLDVVRARPFNHTGPGQSDQFVASSFARQIAEIEAGRRAPVLEVGNLESVRDFLDVSDVVAAYRRLLDPRVPVAAYNVARGEGTPVRALLELLLARARVRPEVRVDAARLRPTDVSVGGSARLRRATGWRPRIRLERTLHALLEDWRRRVSDAP